VLDAVLVARDQAAADAPVVRILPVLVQEVAVAVEPLDDLRADGRLLAEPDRREQDEDVGGDDPLEQRRPLVARPAVRSCRDRSRSRSRGRSRICSTATPLRSMIAIDRSARPCVFDTSGDRLSVQLT